MAEKSTYNTRPLVGAIRWDAWHGELSEVGKIMEKTLSLVKYHSRLPWFARINSDGTVKIRGDFSDVLEQELFYAIQANLDYWAFVLYPEDHPLSIPINWFLKISPSIRQDFRFCAIVEWERFGGPEYFQIMLQRLIEYFRHPAYLKVMGNRPLIYLLVHGRESLLKQWGSVESFRVVTENLRKESKNTGLGNPYIAVMHFSAPEADRVRSIIGADAISAYAFGEGSEEGMPFNEVIEEIRKKWKEMISVSPAIPLVSLGWDPRPRIDTPVPWVQYRPLYYNTFSPEECALVLKDALDLVCAHPDRCEANAIITYAWNEFDEGGWICPTLGEDGKPDTRRIEAIGQLLRSYDRSLG